jgi:signal transduction histidine kinase/CheY-like chemotaxis protein
MKFQSPLPETKEPVQGGDLAIIQAEYLQANLYVANLGTTSVVLLLAAFFWDDDLEHELLVWAAVGLLSTVFRSLLMYLYRDTNAFERKPNVAKRYLYLYSCATLLSGLTFGYGWLTVVPHLSSYEQLIYLLSIVALLFGGLFAYSPYFPAYLGFSATALWLSPLLLNFSSEIYVTGLAFGIWLISLVSTMFAYRFSDAFKVNKELEFNVYRLLSEITHKRDEAVAANLAKSRFLASVSHDLRQPMQAVSLTLNTLEQLLVRKAGGENTQRLIEDNLTGLQHSVEYLNSMFEALVSISRLDASALTINIEYQEIDTLFKNLEYEYKKIAEQEHLKFEIVVPPTFNQYLVKTDIHLLERLLRNLITNAIRYTPKGGVRLAARLAAESINIRVVDTGLGVPLSMRSRIFDEFVQIRSPLAREKNVGMGLGLSIAKRLSRLLGSRIHLSTHAGLGSTFSFSLPIRRSAVVSPTQKKSVEGHVGLERLEQALLVVIDDDPMICEATKMMLELYGAEVITAESGDAAIQALIFSPRSPDLILSDYRLIDETGLDCIEKIRSEFNEDIPAIIITGDTAPAELKLLKNAGLEILYKPVPADALLLSVIRHLRVK